MVTYLNLTFNNIFVFKSFDTNVVIIAIIISNLVTSTNTNSNDFIKSISVCKMLFTIL